MVRVCLVIILTVTRIIHSCFLFKHVADWDINLGCASTAPVPWVRYSDALGSR